MSVLSRKVCPAPDASARVTARRRPASSRPVSGRSRTPARRPARPRPSPSRHSTDADEHVLGVVVGRRPGVRGHEVRPRAAGPSSGRRGPAASPLGVCQVVVITLVPGHVGPVRGHVDAVRTEPEGAGPAVQQVPERARRVERGHAEPVDRAVRARPAPRCGSSTGTRSRRSAGTVTTRDSRPTSLAE